jgi:hypothetical protein
MVSVESRGDLIEQDDARLREGGVVCGPGAGKFFFRLSATS